MQSGVVRFCSDRGFGFVRPDASGEPDVFLHISVMRRCGIESLVVGDCVEFESMTEARGPVVSYIELIGAPEKTCPMM